MVMHARKQPKLSDGYTDRKDTRLHQDMQYHSSLFTDDSDDDGHSLGNHISPRYQNKPSFVERNTEVRGPLSFAEKKVSHYLATGSLGRPVPLDNKFIFNGDTILASVIPDSHKTASSSNQNKERPDTHGQRGVAASSSDQNKERPDTHGQRGVAASSSDQNKDRPDTHGQRGVAASSSDQNKERPDIHGQRGVAASSSDQNKDRPDTHGQRGVADSNSHLGSKPASNNPTPLSVYHQHPTKNLNRSLSHPQPTGGDNNSHSEKDNKISTSFLGSNGKQVASTAKDKEQVQKSALRVCGDWSEHISSSGKRYYYNCKTEVSQWEKPKEWNNDMCRTPDHRAKDGRPRMLSQSHANRISTDGRASRHSNSSDHHQQNATRSHHPANGDLAPDSHQEKEPTFSFAHRHYRDSRESRNNQQLPMESTEKEISHTQESSNMQNSTAEISQPAESTGINSHPHSYHHQMTAHHLGPAPRNNGFSDLKHTDVKRFHHDGQYPPYADYKRLSSEVNRRKRMDSQGSQRNDNGQGPVDDMDISLSPYSSSSHPSSTTSTPQLPPTSTPMAVSTETASSFISKVGESHQASSSSSSLLGNPIPTLVNRQPVIKEAIQTLQELQKVLSMHIRAQQSTVSTRPTQVQARHTTASLLCQHGTPSQNLIYPAGQGTAVVSGNLVAAQHQPYPGGQVQVPALMGLAPATQGEEELVGGTSPVSGTSSRSTCGSPTPSDSSSQNAAVTSLALSAAAIKREETAKLTASLSNYYNESLIGHVLGWQADLVEKQAAKLWEESMVIGSEQCNQISVQLKKARSHVRIAEIQSTLHEQRVMSSDQQYEEIENLKISYSFLPS